MWNTALNLVRKTSFMEDNKDNKVNIAFTDLKKTYENKINKTSLTALHIPGTINIMKGEVTTILGYSASGKSTLLNLLALIDKPDAPSKIEVYHQNKLQDVSNLKENEIVDIRKQFFGFIFQAGHLLSHFKTGQNIAIPLYLNEHSDDYTKNRTEYLLDKAFTLDTTNANTNHNESNPSNTTDTKSTASKDPRERYPITLSGGQYLRTAVMRGISHNPKILFADEPTGNLDPATGRTIMEHIINGWMEQDDHDKKSLIMVTHDYKHAYTHSDRILVLADGSLVLDIQREGVKGKHIFTGKSFTKKTDGKMRPEEIKFENDKELLVSVEQLSGKQVTSETVNGPPTDTPAVNNANQPKSSFLFKFSLKYAIRELCYKKNLPLTIMNVATISILIISVLVIGGIFCGTGRFLDAKLDKNPMLKRMLFWSSASNSGGKTSSEEITDDVIGKIMSLKSESGSLRFQEPVIKWKCSVCGYIYDPEKRDSISGIPDDLVCPAPACGAEKKSFDKGISWLKGDIIDNALPFYEHRIRFYNADGEPTLGKMGRTVHKEDPLIQILKFTEEGIKGNDIYLPTFEGLDSEGMAKGFPFGIIISQKTLKELGYTDQDNYPEEIYISYVDSRKTRLQVVGVATNIEIPYNFLVTDDYYAAFHAKCWNQEYLYNKAYLGPFTKETAGNLKNAFDKYISEVMKDIPMLLPLKVTQRNENEEYWLVFSINSSEKPKLWTKAQFKKNLYNGLQYNNPKGIELPGCFVFLDSVHKPGVSKDLVEELKTQNKLLLGAYFKDIKDMTNAVPLFKREINLAFDVSKIKYLSHILFIKSLGFWIFIIVSGIVSLAALCNIFLSFYQNIKGKTAEIGILRAIGASKGLVYRFYSLESVFLWVSAFLFGIAVSYPLGVCLGLRIESIINADGDEPLFYMQWQLILIAAGVTIFICLLGALLAVGRTIKKITPAEAVRYQGN